MVPSLTLVRQFCPPDEDMAQVRGAPTPKSPSSRLKTGPWVFKTTGHNCSNPIHGGLEYKGKQEQQLKESKVKPHRTGCSLPEQVLVRDGRTEQHPMLHSLQQLAATAQQGQGQGAQPPHMASGEKQDKAQASAHLTAQQEDSEKCGVGAGSPGIHPQTLHPLQGRGQPHRSSPSGL